MNIKGPYEVFCHFIIINVCYARAMERIVIISSFGTIMQKLFGGIFYFRMLSNLIDRGIQPLRTLPLQFLKHCRTTNVLYWQHLSNLFLTFIQSFLASLCWGVRGAPGATMGQMSRTIRDLNTTRLPKTLRQWV